MPDESVRVRLTVNGRELEAAPGEMLIAATDRAGIYVPRFCYHPKLSVAANCRMCLVDVAGAPKPMPACALPVAEGMEVETRSGRAIAAQRATMEFLLINHPLDCPVCDQGGECELQDLAMGFGRDISRFSEGKRAVRDPDLGPLVSTDMTRCIHCTRCIRFGEEVAGVQELGATGRSEHMEITTHVERSLKHELSGNVIDVCPVGALNNKPYRFTARAWEMSAHATVAPHDCVGSALYAHVLRGRVRRIVPRENEAVNETWISDRDRFSCEGLYVEDRLERPLVRRGGPAGGGRLERGAGRGRQGPGARGGGAGRRRAWDADLSFGDCRGRLSPRENDERFGLAQHRSQAQAARFSQHGAGRRGAVAGDPVRRRGVAGLPAAGGLRSAQRSADPRPPGSQGCHGRRPGQLSRPDRTGIPAPDPRQECAAAPRLGPRYRTFGRSGA